MISNCVISNHFYYYTLKEVQIKKSVWIYLLLELEFSLKKKVKKGTTSVDACLLVPLACFQTLCSDCSPSLLVSCLFFRLSRARNSVPLESKKNNPDPPPTLLDIQNIQSKKQHIESLSCMGPKTATNFLLFSEQQQQQQQQHLG